LALGTILGGWALSQQRQVTVGIAQMQQGLAAYGAMGAQVRLTGFLAMLAEAHEAEGQVEDGLRVLAEALEVVDKKGERVYEAEVYRLKGELTLRQDKEPGATSKASIRQKAKGTNLKAKLPNPQSPTSNPQTEAEACFVKALDIARQQSAKSLELRAAMSLARLCRSQGKQREAWHQLAQIYSSFTEGFQTADLREAKALLDELSQASLA